jgi:hypothetical protein
MGAHWGCLIENNADLARRKSDWLAKLGKTNSRRGRVVWAEALLRRQS